MDNDESLRRLAQRNIIRSECRDIDGIRYRNAIVRSEPDMSVAMLVRQEIEHFVDAEWLAMNKRAVY